MSDKPTSKIRTIIRILILLIGVIICVRACAAFQEDQRKEDRRRATERRELKEAYDGLGEAIREKHAATKEQKEAARKAAADDIASFVMFELICNRAAALATHCQQAGISQTSEELTGTPFSILLSYKGTDRQDLTIIKKTLRDMGREAHQEAQQRLTAARDCGLYTTKQVEKYATLAIPSGFAEPFDTELFTITVYPTKDGAPAAK